MSIKIIKIICSIISICVVSAAIGVAFYTSGSFERDIDQRQFMNSKNGSVNPDLNYSYYTGIVNGIEDIEKVSDYVVKVKVDANATREANKRMTITNANVLEVYKGDITEKDIYIIEPIYHYNEDDCVKSIDGYSWMKDETEYILFLNRYKDVNLGKQDYIYLVSTTDYSKYNLNDINDYLMTDYIKYEGYLYDEIDGIERKYNELWKAVIEQYKN